MKSIDPMTLSPDRADKTRVRIIDHLLRTDRFGILAERAMRFEVGMTGHGKTPLDEQVAAEKGLQPLSPFERWLLAPDIEMAKKHFSTAWKDAVFEVTGEDPDEEW